MGGKAKYLLRGRKRPPTFPWCQTVGGPFRALSGARKCLPTRPGHESGVRDSRGRPAILVRWLYEIRREIVLKKISTRGRPLQLQSAPDRSYRDRASTNGSRLKPLRRRFRNHEEHRAHGEGEHTRHSQGGRRNHAWGQTGSGDCDTGHPPACGDFRLLAISAGLSKGASQRRTGKRSGASSQARRTLPATS